MVATANTCDTTLALAVQVPLTFWKYGSRKAS